MCADNCTFLDGSERGRPEICRLIPTQKKRIANVIAVKYPLSRAWTVRFMKELCLVETPCAVASATLPIPLEWRYDYLFNDTPHDISNNEHPQNGPLFGCSASPTVARTERFKFNESGDLGISPGWANGMKGGGGA